jgi:hypothetical protein
MSSVALAHPSPHGSENHDRFGSETTADLVRNHGRFEHETMANSGGPPEKDREGPEEDVAAAIDEQAMQAVRALTASYFVTEAQLAELAAAYVENGAGVARCFREARRGEAPVALLLTMVRAGAHREVQAASDEGPVYQPLTEPV